MPFQYERGQDVPLMWTAFSGSCAGVAYWTVPFPADTVYVSKVVWLQ